MATIDLADVQGIVLRGYGSFDVSRYALLQVSDPARARAWLRELAPSVHAAAQVIDPDTGIVPDPVYNLAFTYSGLLALGLRPDEVAGFSNEFREGMVTPHRRRLLRDSGLSDPDGWEWGGPKNELVHVMLLLYAPKEQHMKPFWERHRDRFETAGLRLVRVLDATTLPGRREHFGFRDGIAQPYVKGDDPDGPAGNRVAAGEFVLGYRNEYGVYPDSPRVTGGRGRLDLLDPDPSGRPGRDLGRNGSYLVFRQMSQDPVGFWRFVRDHAGSPEAAVKLASQMVGRWPSGAPLARYPDADPGGLSDEDDFAYRAVDPNGERCPIGSHVRRTNPRDGLLDSTAQQSTRIVNHHRIIRRSRAYGDPIVQSMDPFELMAAEPPGRDVGLHFVCFNANIANQFQFIQFNWAGSAKFERFYADPDPLIGVQPGGPPARFTIPGTPARQVVPALQRFVEMRGGAYLFMPGKRALHYLASL